MLKQYKVKIIEAIKDRNLLPEFFDFIENKDNVEIQLKGSELKFYILENPSSFHNFKYKYVEFTPDNKLNSGQTSFYMSIDGIIIRFYKWIDSEVKIYFHEQNIVDYFDLYRLKETNFNKIDYSESVHYSPEEKEELIEKIESFYKLIKSKCDLNDEKLTSIMEQLNYLKEAVDRLQKRDWKGVALSTLIGIVTSATVDRTIGNQLFEYFKNSFGFFKALPF